MDTHHVGFPFGLPFFLFFAFFPQKVGALLGSPLTVLDDWVYIPQEHLYSITQQGLKTPRGSLFFHL